MKEWWNSSWFKLWLILAKGALPALLLCSCASYTTLQQDAYFSGTNIVRVATTRVTIRTFASAKSELARSSVTQASRNSTNVMQYSRIGSITQFATNNLPEIAKETATGVIEGLKIP